MPSVSYDPKLRTYIVKGSLHDNSRFEMTLLGLATQFSQNRCICSESVQYAHMTYRSMILGGETNCCQNDLEFYPDS